MKNNKFHFYCLSFIQVDNGMMYTASAYIANKTKQVTQKHIEAAKPMAKVKCDACLIAASYLGCMTVGEFQITQENNNADREDSKGHQSAEEVPRLGSDSGVCDSGSEE